MRTTILALCVALLAACGQQHHSRDTRQVQCYHDDLLWWYIIMSNNGSCYYYSSPAQINNFTTVNWTAATSVPSQVANMQPNETVEVSETEIEADVADATEGADITGEGAGDGSWGSETPEGSEWGGDGAADSGDSGGGDGGGDSGGGDGGGGGE